MQELDTLFANLQKSTFRRRFRLNTKDTAYLARHDLAIIQEHAEHFVAQRLAPARPANDGRQTPMRNHPVFVAQHATACCCRRCLATWHGIATGQPLSDAEQAHIVAAIMRWLSNQPVPPGDRVEPQTPHQPDLFN